MELLPVQVSRVRFLKALRHFLDRKWGEVTSDEHATCVGVILLALQEVGLLPPDFDANLSDIPPSRRFGWLMNLLRANAHNLAPNSNDGIYPGDILLSCWTDVDNRLSVVHHVAVYSSDNPTPFGSHLQSLSRKHGGADMVYEAPMSGLDWHRIESVWRLHSLTDGEA